MWLLKLHFAVSILCLLVLIGVNTVLLPIVKDNGWGKEKHSAKEVVSATIRLVFTSFIPLINLLVMLASFIMILVKKEDYYKWSEKAKNNKG
jgi:peptidoglycan biosynthesis protein MviN/MurJ (putative lipid II flippase)